MAEITLACACDAVRGRLDPQRAANRLVCHCEDCRAFALACGGGAALDAAGGLDLLQTTFGRLRLERGGDALAALRVTPRGPLRWHCARCRSALAVTTARPTLPFVSVVAAALAGDRTGLPAVRGVVYARSAPAAPLHPPAPLPGVMARVARAMLGGRLRGEHRRSPFHGSDGRPVAEPRTMDAGERAALLSPGPDARP